MLHFRKIVFDLIAAGFDDQKIFEALNKEHSTEFTMPRIANYRATYNRLTPVERDEFVIGKRDLLGNKL